MRTPKVRLYLRIRALGRDAYVEPVYNRNRTLRQGYALVGNQAEHHPEGVYYLRFAHAAGRRQWKAVGSCADVAAVALRNMEHDLRAEALGRISSSAATIPEIVEKGPAPMVRVGDAIDSYLEVVRLSRAPKTFAAYRNILSLFN